MVAVDRITFDVRAGETFGLLGPNGAGKTTTMRMMACISPPTSGELSVNGLDVYRHSRAIRDFLGVVAQHDGLDPDLSARNNLIVHARYYGLLGKPAEARADEVLEFFGLTAKAGDDVDNLSGGLKRRLTIARAFMHRPRMVILDEPTTGLDPQSRNRVWEQLAVLKQAGVTIAMSTHYMEEAAALCDRLVIIDHGRILAEGTPGEVVHRFAGSETAIIRVEPGAREPLVASMTQRGYHVYDHGTALVVHGRDGDRPVVDGVDATRISYRTSTLEDAFLALTGRELRDE
ncbi:MAG: ABC transporter ATP-binding protein [Chloroflexi bacterium]|nr:ABC transporter ATP-binding protein [Chloroflexota bacterium]